jgi:Domain of unknown function (DUF4055)
MHQAPTNNPELPSFLHPDYLHFQDDLRLVNDVWSDLKGCIPFYIRREHKEPTKAYQDRLERSQFDNRFEPAIRGHAGLLSAFNLEDNVAATIRNNIENIDNQGNDIYTFFTEADQMVLRDGWCGIFVDFPPIDPAINSQADFLESDRKPYLVAIDRRNILNWQLRTIAGKPELTQVTLREIRLEKVGRFGSRLNVYYRVLSPGIFQVYQLIPTQQDWQLILVDQGETSIDFIPLVCYSVSESALFQAKPPLINLARLNIEHFQKRSQLNEVLRKCNLPVPVRKGLIKSMADLKNAPPVTIGPNSALDIPSDGDFYFAEPSGSAIASTKQDIADLEMAMDRVSLAFLAGGESDKTATEVLLNSAQTSANLKGMAGRKQSAIQQVFDYWVQYTGEGNGGNIAIDDSILQLPLSPEQVNRLESLAQTGFISQETLLYQLKLGKVLSRNFDVEAEIQLTQGGNNDGNQAEG